ncbi:septal ring lytic transglycosylase RlpA family protein [Sulfurimonas sp.]|jgi:rare lipoprotein A|uniref:septal ring lytic transglycosylase RlpA family protein n=1 Tax=Sulfurimonas sp. TaxID=2022749 RepID=UPI0025EF2FDC|nr:septal ring lytic transglycosylase RlpA family protein [Sulfurimonas sp.]MCK9472445.1 septal ring lytic transglycosylase RlpA family protein [Sulfurimonas sp.]MDD3505935.1 septal ring lytic transglycosylase RlpA family protein [Sulfurimonas sp.]
MNKLSFFIIPFVLILTTGCSTRGARTYTNFGETKTYSQDSSAHSSVISKKDYKHPTMKPYVIRGIKYYPTVVNVGDEFSGNASWYGPDFHGKLTSNGETYNMYDMTAAHKTLPMNTIVKVTNKKNGLNTVVRINDRGPFIATRIIDLSNTAARKIGMLNDGTAPVKIEIIGFHSKDQKKVPLNRELKESPQDQIVDGFAIQIASFSRIEGAIFTQKKYDDTDGYKTIIKDMHTENGRMFKVWLKGFRSEQEARDYKSLGNFKDSFIVRED